MCFCLPVGQQPPQVVVFGVNTAARQIAFFFNSSMNASSCAVQALTLQNTSDVAQGSSLTPVAGSCVTDPFNQTNPSAIGVSLSAQDWQAIDSNPDLFTTTSNTFVSMTSSFIQSTDGVYNQPIPSSSAFQVTQFLTVDQSDPPGAQTALLDLNTGILTVTFNMSVQFIDAALFAVVSTAGRHELTGGVVTIFGNGLQANLSLSIADLNSIKVQLVSSQPPAALELQPNAVGDPPNNLHSLNLSLTPDTTSPEILGFSLDLTSETLVITFSEPISVMSYDISTVLITSNTQASSYSIGGGTIDSTTPNTVVTVNLATLILNQLKSDSNIATSTGNTYLLAMHSNFQDVFGNLLTNLSTPLPVTNFIVDTVQPMLVSYTVDLDNGNMQLTFSEPIETTSFSAGQLLINSSHPIALAGSSATFLSLDTSVTLMLLSTTLDEIKLVVSEGKPLGLYFNPSVASDTSGNPVSPILLPNLLNPQTMVPDTTPPVLVQFLFDLDAGELRLGFSEPIEPLSVNISSMYLTGVLTTTAQGNGLTGTLTSTASPILTIRLSQASLTSIKANMAVGTSMSSTFIYLAPNSVVDLFGNSLLAVASQVSTYKPDVTPPQILSVSMDMNVGSLTVTFFEPISPNSLNTSSTVITPIAPPNPITSSAPVSITNLTVMQSSTLLSGSISDSLNAIKVTLTGQVSSARLASTGGFVSDTSGNTLGNFSIQISAVTPDTQSPMLVNVIPNQVPPRSLNNMSITFIFTEPVLLSSLDIATVSMEIESQGVIATFSSFSGGAWNTGLTTATYYFSQTDLETDEFAMRYLTGTYISYVLVTITGALASDTAGNLLLSPSSDFQHNGQGMDFNPPSLQSFSLDLDSGQLQLTFSKAVIIQTIPDSITIQDDGSNPIHSVALSSSEYTNQQGLLGSIITLMLVPSDTSAIINMGALGTSTTNTYLQIQPSLAIDYEGNEIIPGVAVQAAVVILPAATNSSTVAQASSTVVLTPMSTVTLSSTVLTIPLLTSTLAVLPSSSSVLSTSPLPVASSAPTLPETSTILMAMTAPAPMSTSVSSSTAPPVTSVVAPSSTPSPPPSQTSPVLTAANLDLDNGQLTMNFNVPISTASVTLSSVLFTNGDSTYSLTGGQAAVATGTNGIAVSLVKTDLDAVKFLLHTTTGTTWRVTLNEDAVTSTNGTGNQQHSLPITSITPDTTSPLLNSYTMDLNSGRMLLTFSEPIETSNYNLQEIFVNGTSSSAVGYTLQGSTISTSFYSTIFDIAVSSSALNALKLDSSVATQLSNTFLFTSSKSFRDVGGNPVEEITNGLLPTMYTPDSTSPWLTSFTLDLDSGLLSLTFSEAIVVSSFDAAGLRITNNAQQQAVVISDFTLSSSVSSDEVYLMLLSILNDVKLLITSGGVQQAYLSVTSSVAADTSGNNVVAIPNATPLAASSVTADTTAPMITAFTAGTPSSATVLTFMFNEYVSATSWNEASITLYLNTPLGSFTYSDLSAGSVTSPVSSTVTYLFSNTYYQGQFAIRYQQAYYSGTIGLMFTSGLVRDLSNNMVLPQTSPLTYNSSTSDPVHPQLQSFSLDLNAGRMTMTFSEPVEVKEIPGNVRIQNSATTPSFIHTLVSSAYSSQQGTTGQTISLTLQQVDISGLNNNDNLANSLSDTFLFLTTDFAVDFSGNDLIAQTSGLQATSVTVYTGPVQPHVIAFDLDLDSDQLTFEFDTPVQVSSFNPALVTLVNAPSISTQTALVRLSNVTVIARDEQQRFRVLLSTKDIVNVKRHPVCYTTADCYAVFDQGVVTASSGSLPSAAVTTPLMVTSLLPDVTPPRFLAFPVFDLNTGFFTFIFSEPINGSSIDFTQVTFSNALTNPTKNVTLTEGVTSPDNVEIDFFMPKNDLNALKYKLDLCTSRDNCWVQLPSFFISDIGSNPFLHSNTDPNAQASYHQPTVFIPDRTAPVLEQFNVDLNQGQLLLSFSEVVNESLFSPSDITLLNAPFGTLRLRLYNESVFTRVNNGTALQVLITVADLNSLKSQNLFTSVDNSFLSFQTDLTDVSGNAFIDIHHSSPLKVAVLTLDITPPQLTSFYYFNIDNGSFYIAFSEPVDSSSTNITRVTLTGSSSSSSPSLRLTGGMVTTLNAGRMEIEVQLSHDDRVAIKLLSGLATSQSNTWIAMDVGAISDTGGNINTATVSPLPLSASGFIPDTTTAGLLSVDLDMNIGNIRMVFSDVIDASTVTLSLLRIQNMVSAPTRFLNLTSSVSSATSSDAVRIFLSTVDHNNVKRDLNLATNISNTFFSFSGMFASDVENRPVDSVSILNAQQLTSYTPDTTPPGLDSYQLDMDTGILYFTFYEPVLISGIDPTSVTLSNAANTPTDQYQLTGGTASSVPAGAPADTKVSLQLTYNDLNTIKSKTTLATTISNVYLSFTPDYVVDTSNIPVVAITSSIASSFEPDTTLPELQYFDVDLVNGGTLTMKFTEAVQFTNSLQSTITLLNNPSGAGIQISLDTSETATIASPIKDIINITLSSTHTSRLSTDPLIASSTDNLYISINAGGVYDFSDGNIGLGQSIAPTTAKVRYICESKSTV